LVEYLASCDLDHGTVPFASYDVLEDA